MLSLLLALVVTQEAPEALQTRVREALATGDRARIESLFARKEDSAYLLAMAGGSRRAADLEAFVFPTPPGWQKSGPYWVTFHKFQDIQQHHDPIHALVRTPEGWKIGAELPEWDTDHRTKGVVLDVRLQPREGKATIDARMQLESTGERAPVFRLNKGYTILGPGGPDKVVVARGEMVVQPRGDNIVRVGGLVIPWTNKLTTFHLKYQAAVNEPRHDKINDRVAYLTAFWVPDLARLPYTAKTRIVGPAGWVLRSEGDALSPDDAAFGTRAKVDLGEKVIAYKCDLPISFPKVIAGAYKVAAEKTVGRHTFRSYQLDPMDKARGEKIVERFAQGMEFFEKTLAPFPFSGYDNFDGHGYYGIESYSHTLLEPNISVWAATHEMGHTYFGGMAPSAYVRDTWNEGVTTYVDDILLQKNMQVLDSGLKTIDVPRALSRMAVAWDNGSATYFRGAYVMRMLEHEIGWEPMIEGLRALVTERQGMETLWKDLRPIFEKSSGRDLGWFWKQWIDGATFPTLEISEATRTPGGSVRVLVRQRGPQEPFRMRFRIEATAGSQTHEEIVQMTNREQAFELKPPFRAESVQIDVKEWTFARTGEPRRVP